MLWLILACSGGDGGVETAAPTAATSAEDTAGPCAAAPAVSWSGWGEGFFITWCQACHSATTAERNGAPEGVDFDTAAEVLRWRDQIDRVVLSEGSMPVGGGLSDDDLALLELLLWCPP